MSLYLPEQKLGSHSQEGTASQKFILKGRQTGAMHIGHTWVFRAESYDTMMAWYSDIKVLTEKTPQERNDMFGLVTRSGSRASRRSTSSDTRAVEEEDEEPFSAREAVDVSGRDSTADNRPQPGGRFPSDIQVNAQRGMEVGGSPSSGSSGAANGQVNFAGADPRDAGPVYHGYYGTYVDGAHPDGHAHAREAKDNPYANQGLYQPMPIHSGATTKIYQYQTPSRGNSYAEGAMDGSGPHPQGQGGGSQQGHSQNVYGAGVAYQATNPPPDGQGEKEYTTSTAPAASSVPAVNTNSTASQPRTVQGEQQKTQDVPQQGVSRASTLTNIHVPGGYPKSATNVADGHVAGQN